MSTVISHGIPAPVSKAAPPGQPVVSVIPPQRPTPDIPGSEEHASDEPASGEHDTEEQDTEEHAFQEHASAEHVAEEHVPAEHPSSEPPNPGKQFPSEAPPHQDSSAPSEPAQHRRRFVVLVPANSPNPNLCKLMLSAIALGYPAPHIVNWGLDPRDASNREKGKALLKVPGIVRYLEALTSESAHPDDKLDDDDIVLIVDGFDIWFQLPPDVLLAGYHEINKEANAQLREQWKGDGPLPASMKQTIVAASQKKCYPGPESNLNLHCDLLPKSPARSDLYGPQTDKSTASQKYHNIRPRFINGGAYMGPAGDMRRMFRRALFKLEEGVGKGLDMYSEQGLSGEVFGEQEIWRQRQRGSKQTAGGDDDVTALMDRDYEYHMGLDYHQVLSIATVFEEPDGDIVALNNQSAIDSHSEKLGISPVRLHGVPNDVKAARNPLADVLPSADWGQMPLYADFFSESVPVMLHHNAHKDGLKERRVWWWDRTWYFQYLRQLLAVRLKPTGLTPLATVQTADGKVAYWAPNSEKTRRKPRIFGQTAVEPLIEAKFDDICRYGDDEPDADGRKWWDEVFRDGKGPL